MTQPIGKASLTDSKTTMSLASTPPAPAATPGTANQDTGKILRKTNDFQTRKVRAEKEDEARLLHYLEEAQHVQKVQSGVNYGLRMSPVFNDFLEKTHEMWQKDKQDEEESEDESEEDYLPPLPAYKITNRNKHTYLGATVFLVNEYDKEDEVRLGKRKRGELGTVPDNKTKDNSKDKSIKMRAIEQEQEIARLTPYPIKSMLKIGKCGV